MVKSLNSLRFIFALLVFSVHLGWTDLATGHAFFILLSGFVLTLAYQEKLVPGVMSYWGFIKKRLIRIYPLHVITLILAIPFTLNELVQDGAVWTLKFVLNLLHLHVFVPEKGFYFSFNSVTWNSAILLVFYFLFPFFLILIKKMSSQALWMGFLFIVLTIVFSGIMIPKEYHHYYLYISPYFRVFDFLIGMMLFQLIKNRNWEISKRKGTLLEISAVFMFILFFSLVNRQYEYFLPWSYSILLWIVLVPLIAVFYYEKGWISQQILALPVFQELGKISFGFYMFHLIVMRYLGVVSTKIGLEVNGFLFAILALLITVLLALKSENLSKNQFSKLLWLKA